MSELQYDISNKKMTDMYKDREYLDYVISALPYSDGTKAFAYHYAMHAARSSRYWKYLYYSLSAVIIALPILSSFGEAVATQYPWISHVGNGLVTISASVLALFRCHEKWTRYRAYLEKLINLIAVYPVGSENDPEKSERGFVEEIEGLNAEHQILWAREREHDKE